LARLWRNTAATAALAAAVLLFVAFGASYASANALPGQPLYPIKRGLELARLWILSGEAELAWRLDLAERRLSEAVAVPAAADGSLGDFNREITAGVALAERAIADGTTRDEIVPPLVGRLMTARGELVTGRPVLPPIAWRSSLALVDTAILLLRGDELAAVPIPRLFGPSWPVAGARAVFALPLRPVVAAAPPAAPVVAIGGGAAGGSRGGSGGTIGRPGTGPAPAAAPPAALVALAPAPNAVVPAPAGPGDPPATSPPASTPDDPPSPRPTLVQPTPGRTASALPPPPASPTVAPPPSAAPPTPTPVAPTAPPPTATPDDKLPPVIKSGANPDQISVGGFSDLWVDVDPEDADKGPFTYDWSAANWGEIVYPDPDHKDRAVFKANGNVSGMDLEVNITIRVTDRNGMFTTNEFKIEVRSAHGLGGSSAGGLSDGTDRPRQGVVR
jgi:hypothetical protein